MTSTQLSTLRHGKREAMFQSLLPRPSLLLRRFVFRMAEARDHGKGTDGRRSAVSSIVSFPPSFARTFSSKERRLGTRQPQATSMVEGAELASLRAGAPWRRGKKRRLLLTPNSFPSSLPHPSTPEHPRRACSQECSQATGLLQCGFFRCHATLLSTPPLWGGALRDDTKKGCGADYGFSRPDAASGCGSLFQAARYSSGEFQGKSPGDEVGAWKRRDLEKPQLNVNPNIVLSATSRGHQANSKTLK